MRSAQCFLPLVTAKLACHVAGGGWFCSAAHAILGWCYKVVAWGRAPERLQCHRFDTLWQRLFFVLGSMCGSPSWTGLSFCPSLQVQRKPMLCAYLLVNETASIAAWCCAALHTTNSQRSKSRLTTRHLNPAEPNPAATKHALETRGHPLNPLKNRCGFRINGN